MVMSQFLKLSHIESMQRLFGASTGVAVDYVGAGREINLDQGSFVLGAADWQPVKDLLFDFVVAILILLLFCVGTCKRNC